MSKEEKELWMPHAMRAERIAEQTGRPLQEVLADFPESTKPLIPVVKTVVDGRVVWIRRPK